MAGIAHRCLGDDIQSSSNRVGLPFGQLKVIRFDNRAMVKEGILEVDGKPSACCVFTIEDLHLSAVLSDFSANLLPLMLSLKINDHRLVAHFLLTARVGGNTLKANSTLSGLRHSWLSFFRAGFLFLHVGASYIVNSGERRRGGERPNSNSDSGIGRQRG